MTTFRFSGSQATYGLAKYTAVAVFGMRNVVVSPIIPVNNTGRKHVGIAVLGSVKKNSLAVMGYSVYSDPIVIRDAEDVSKYRRKRRQNNP